GQFFSGIQLFDELDLVPEGVVLPDDVQCTIRIFGQVVGITDQAHGRRIHDHDLEMTSDLGHQFVQSGVQQQLGGIGRNRTTGDDIQVLGSLYRKYQVF